MSGWDQHNDQNDDPDWEYRWLIGITFVACIVIVVWFVWPWVN